MAAIKIKNSIIHSYSIIAGPFCKWYNVFGIWNYVVRVKDA
jgi:hypothetical protein